jgi:hypothetical protein
MIILSYSAAFSKPYSIFGCLYMNIKRISYFTFWVAVSTIATVSHCAQAKAALKNSGACSANLHEQNTCNNIVLVIDNQISSLFDFQNDFLQEGLKTGKIKVITTTQENDEAIHVYLTFDKDYKGSLDTPFAKGLMAPVQNITALAVVAHTPSVTHHVTVANLDYRSMIHGKCLKLVE